MKQIRRQPLSATYQQLNSLLCNTALSIQTTDYTATAKWARLIQQVKKTCAIFKSYAEKEENILFPLLHSYEPALVAILRDNQRNRMHYLSAFCELFTAAQAANDKQKSKLFSHTLLYRFDEFVASVLQQLNEQERMINAVLWNYYNDKELAQIAASFSISLSVSTPEKDFTFADNIINKAYKQQLRADKELALAV
jgi:hypothetical protein